MRTRKGGYEEGFWLGNDKFCEASNAIKFPDGLNLGKGIVDEVRVSRRFFSSGFAVCWFEFLFSIEQTEEDADKANANFEAVLERIIALKIKIAQKGKASAESSILESGPALAKRYLENSTISKASPPPEKWWVSAGQPVMMIIAPDSKQKVKGVVTDPYRDSSFQSIGLDDIYHYTLHFPSEASTAVWRFHPNSARFEEFKYEIRSLRVNILRMHVEKECLIEVLRHIIGNHFILDREAQECQNLQHFLAVTLKKLQLAQKNPVATKATLNRVFQLHELAHKAEISNLLQQLEVIRGTLLRNLGDFLNTASESST
ncbi:MAG: hypothetical protein ACKVU0_15000 [Saprospiraceae bacterium]